MIGDVGRVGAGGWRRAAAALLAATVLSGCAAGGLEIGGNTEREPDLEVDKIARMSAEGRYDTSVGCASTARLALVSSDPAALEGFGFEPSVAATAAVQFAASTERNAWIGEAAARDAIDAGAALGVSEADARGALEADYARLADAFAGVAAPQPQIALYTITDRLERCAALFPYAS